MTTRIIGGTTALLVLGACAFEQPPPRCVVGRGVHAVHYTRVSGSAGCVERRSEEVGVQKYNPPGEPQTVALQPDTLFRLGGERTGPSSSPISYGNLPSDEPDGEDFCAVTNVTEGRRPTAEPGRDVRYAWSDVRIYAGASAPGTQWTATVDYSDGSCTGTYKAVGVFPVVYCATNLTPDTNRPIPRPDGTFDVNPELCNQPNPLTSLALDQSFPVRCDNTSGLCVLDSATVPAFKPGQGPRN
jgi:hypothetical protein